MGNCQAIDAAALVVQHPCGRVERFYWPVTASEVMKMNPGHYVSLIMPLPPLSEEDSKQDQKTARFTRVKLLRPTDTLTLGHAYRLVTSQEVMKVLRAKKCAKTKKVSQESSVDDKLQKAEEKQSSGCKNPQANSHIQNSHPQATKHQRHRPRTAATNAACMRSKSWQPSLKSISEAAS